MTKPVALLGAYLLLALPLYAADAEDNAVKAVEKLGGKVTLDNKDAARPIVGVDLSFTELTDAGVKDLAALQRLKTLNLGASSVTSVGVAELQRALPDCQILH